ncbi:hypothetical protein CDAR_243551 [Caerostris darwini]|uniref:Uncharacterized protein n=1 Tax=Caerostris darwini TaxID=1538125 RepID=A0AAV4VCG6_9ARAC|nr:hypothetical protein CDAR_243551 [Caerostris darwini]
MSKQPDAGKNPGIFRGSVSFARREILEALPLLHRVAFYEGERSWNSNSALEAHERSAAFAFSNGYSHAQKGGFEFRADETRNNRRIRPQKRKR